MSFIDYVEDDACVIEKNSGSIAVIGIGVNFPKAKSAEQFWDLLAKSVTTGSGIPEKRKEDTERYFAKISENQKSRKYFQGSYIDDIDQFDYSFFGISKKEADLMDPAQRIFMETSWKCLDDAGYGGDSLRSAQVGVFAGCSNSDQYQNIIQASDDNFAMLSFTGNMRSIVASRISYYMDFKGPSMVIDTACSSSLVAVHLACQSILKQECEYALAGGVNVCVLPVKKEDDYGIESSVSRTRTFDDSSDGTMYGEGAGVILLKSLSRAIEDQDSIYGVIRGSAVNQDGASVGITAPNVESQKQVLMSAWEKAEINPEELVYIEAHGTGTQLGDPIEINALTKAFSEYTDRKQFCAIGTVKTNMGHLDYASGIAGLIKTLLVLQKRSIPSNLHFHLPNRKIAFAESPVYVNDRLLPWEEETAMICGVSSFGLSGTNCHVVVEEYAEEYAGQYEGPQNSMQNQNRGIFVLSSGSYEGLLNSVTQIQKAVECTLCLQALCYTLAVGRKHGPHRLAILFDHKLELMKSLEQFQTGRAEGKNIYYSKTVVKEVFTGTMPTHKEAMLSGTKEALASLAQMYIEGEKIDWEWIYLYDEVKRIHLPGTFFQKQRCWPQIKEGRRIEVGAPVAHPLFDVCIVKSLYQDIYCTYFNLDKHWVVKDHRFMGKCFPPGTAYLEMLQFLGTQYYKGKPFRLQKIMFLKPMELEPDETKKIHTIVEKKEFYYAVTVTGYDEQNDSWDVYAQGELCSRKAEREQIRDVEAIRDRLTKITGKQINNPDSIEDSIGFGPRWTSIQSEIYCNDGELLIKNMMDEQYRNDFMEYLCHPSLVDVSINTMSHSMGNGYYLPLAQDSFVLYDRIPDKLYCHIKKCNAAKDRELVSFDIELLDVEGRLIGSISKHTLKRLHEEDRNKVPEKHQGKAGDWFYKVDWVEEKQTFVKEINDSRAVLILEDQTKESKQLADKLEEMVKRTKRICISVLSEKALKKELVQFAKEDARHLDVVFCDLPGVCSCGESIQEAEDYTEAAVFRFHKILKVLSQQDHFCKMKIISVTEQAEKVTGKEDTYNPYQKMRQGFVRSAALEYRRSKFASIDLEAGTEWEQAVYHMLSLSDGDYLAVRAGKCYVRQFEKVECRESENAYPLKEQGVYLITGGLGGIGFEVAKVILKQRDCKLVIIGKTQIPAIGEGCDARAARRAERLGELQKLGSEIIYYAADIADLTSMRNVKEKVIERYGQINGFIHGAGIMGEGFLYEKKEEDMWNTIRPKITGTLILHKLFENDKLDFILYMSSVTSILGAPGQADYTAANVFLEGVWESGKKKGLPVHIINWSAWKETGMAYENHVEESGIFEMMKTRDAVHAFQQYMSSHMDKAIIGRIQNGINLQTVEEMNLRVGESLLHSLTQREEVMDEQPDYGKVDLASILRTVRTVWCQVFGEEIIEDSAMFNQLGGNSLIATKLLNELDKRYPRKLDITDIFTYPSIREISRYIAKQYGDEKKADSKPLKKEHSEEMDDLDRILELLAEGEISPESVDELLQM